MVIDINRDERHNGISSKGCKAEVQVCSVWLGNREWWVSGYHFLPLLIEARKSRDSRSQSQFVYPSCSLMMQVESLMEGEGYNQVLRSSGSLLALLVEGHIYTRCRVHFDTC